VTSTSTLHPSTSVVAGIVESDRRLLALSDTSSDTIVTRSSHTISSPDPVAPTV